jgi:hypothetical protein
MQLAGGFESLGHLWRIPVSPVRTVHLRIPYSVRLHSRPRTGAEPQVEYARLLDFRQNTKTCLERTVFDSNYSTPQVYSVGMDQSVQWRLVLGP